MTETYAPTTRSPVVSPTDTRPTDRGLTEKGLTEKGARTRARIVDAAAALVLAQGVARTTLDDVGAAAGVGRSQMYHYFTGKADLVDAVIARQTGDLLGPTGLHDVPLDTWHAWEQWADSVVAAQSVNGSTDGCPLGSLASELSAANEPARLALVAAFDRWEGLFRRGLDAMQGSATIRADANTAELARAVLVSLQGGLLMAQARRDPGALRIALDAAIARLRDAAAGAPASQASQERKVC